MDEVEISFEHEFEDSDFHAALQDDTGPEQATAILRLIIGCYNLGWNDHARSGPDDVVRPFIEQFKAAVEERTGRRITH